MEYTSDSDKITRDYFDSLLVETRYLDSTLASSEMELYGKKFSTPVMTAALSHLGNTAENGMVKYAEAAAKANAVHWVGMGDEKELEDICATGASTIKIIKPYEDNERILAKIKHAEKCGCFAVGMDIDHSFSADGKYDFVLGEQMKAKSFDELKDFIQSTKLPFIVKGVLSTRDAEKCLKAGAQGIVVSHHHNMVSYSVPPLFVLPEILNAVSNQIPVFVDCGIESAMDVYKCLALGAKAVSVGRHLMPLLKEGSEKTAGRIIQMTDELKGIMSRTGIEALDKMDPSVIHKRTF